MLLIKVTSSWGNQGKSTEEQGADMSKWRIAQYFRNREENKKVAKLEMESQVEKYKLCLRVM